MYQSVKTFFFHCLDAGVLSHLHKCLTNDVPSELLSRHCCVYLYLSSDKEQIFCAYMYSVGRTDWLIRDKL